LGRSLVDPPLMRRIFLVTWNEFPASRAVAAFIDELRRQSSRWPASDAKDDAKNGTKHDTKHNG
jgi:hypothetical protein